MKLNKPLQVTFSILVVAWIIFGYDRYLSSPEWEAVERESDSMDGLCSIAGVCHHDRYS